MKKQVKKNNKVEPKKAGPQRLSDIDIKKNSKTDSNKADKYKKDISKVGLKKAIEKATTNNNNAAYDRLFKNTISNTSTEVKNKLIRDTIGYKLKDPKSLSATDRLENFDNMRNSLKLKKDIERLTGKPLALPSKVNENIKEFMSPSSMNKIRSSRESVREQNTIKSIKSFQKDNQRNLSFAISEHANDKKFYKTKDAADMIRKIDLNERIMAHDTKGKLSTLNKENVNGYNELKKKVTKHAKGQETTKKIKGAAKAISALGNTFADAMRVRY